MVRGTRTQPTLQPLVAHGCICWSHPHPPKRARMSCSPGDGRPLRQGLLVGCMPPSPSPPLQASQWIARRTLSESAARRRRPASASPPPATHLFTLSLTHTHTLTYSLSHYTHSLSLTHVHTLIQRACLGTAPTCPPLSAHTQTLSLTLSQAYTRTQHASTRTHKHAHARTHAGAGVQVHAVSHAEQTPSV